MASVELPSSTQTSKKIRYNARSSTAIVTQILSDGYNSLIQRLRRNPCEKPEKNLNQDQKR